MKKNTVSRSGKFRATRKQHASELAEDYTELIAELIERGGEARTCEIAEMLGVSHVTAVRAMQRLHRDGFVKIRPRYPVELTAKGRKVAEFSRYRHDLLVRFLVHIG